MITAGSRIIVIGRGTIVIGRGTIVTGDCRGRYIVVSANKYHPVSWSLLFISSWSHYWYDPDNTEWYNETYRAAILTVYCTIGRFPKTVREDIRETLKQY